MLSKKEKIAAMVLAILLHFFFCLQFIENIEKSKNKPVRPPIHKDTIVSLIPMKEVQKKQEEQKKNLEPEKQKNYITDPKICENKDNTYKGIGIIVGFGTDLIIHIPESYPAYIAGMRLGDEIVDLTETEDFDRVIIRRQYQVMTFVIKKEKICFQENQ